MLRYRKTMLDTPPPHSQEAPTADAGAPNQAPNPAPSPTSEPTQPTDAPAPQDGLEHVLGDLRTIDTTDLADQPEVYERIHAALARTLDATVDGQGD